MTGTCASTRLSRRRLPRYQMRVPLDVIMLRAGVSDTLPGRSMNLSEQGIAAVLAGELLPGDHVAVEVRLSATAEPLCAQALVRHHDHLRCGMEFVGLSPEQQAAIRAAQSKAATESAVSEVSGGETGARSGGSENAASPGAPGDSRGRRWNALWLAVFALLVVLTGIFWWRWNREWEQLEAGLPNHENIAADSPRVQVAADVMERLLIHKVEPEYPAAARKSRLQGVIVLNIIVGRDGSVVGVRPMNGPDLLARSAMDALRWWKFEPYRMNGEPAVVETTVAMEFRP
jgi:TonB family protein